MTTSEIIEYNEERSVEKDHEEEEEMENLCMNTYLHMYK